MKKPACLRSILSFALITRVLAFKWSSPVVGACLSFYKNYDFDCGAHSDYYVCLYGSQPFLGSILSCMDNGAKTSKERDETNELVMFYARQYGHRYTVDDLERFRANATKYMRTYLEASKIRIVNFPFTANEGLFEWNEDAEKQMEVFIKRDTVWLGWGLVWFWVVVIAWSTAVNINHRYIGIPVPRTVSQFCRKYITYPSTIKIAPTLFPTRLHTIIISAFVIQVVLSSSIGYGYHIASPYISSKYLVLNMLQHRSGGFSAVMLPILVLFGIRNNPLTYFSGFSFADYMVFHKVAAIIMTTEGLIHSIIWTIYIVCLQSNYTLWVKETSFVCGIIATVIACLMIFVSLKIFRNHAYEVFLVIHNCFSILFVVMIWIHVKHLAYNKWVWGMLSIWCIDRLTRMVRIIMSGGIQTLEVEICDAKVLKISFKKPRWFKYYHGSYLFVSFLTPWFTAWQFHPFTTISSPVEQDGTLTLYVKVMKGVTRRLSQLDFDENGKIKIRGMIEGPYGSPVRSCKVEENCVAVAGGLGITAVLPALYCRFLQDETVQTKTEKQAAKVLKTLTSDYAVTASLYWIINDIRYVKWLHSDLQYLANNGCKVVILLTRKQLTECDSSPHLEAAAYTIFHSECRPDIGLLVSSCVQEAFKTGNDISFYTCGSESFNNIISDKLSENIQVGCKVQLTHHAEAYVW
ncbi:unnamed protein product [Kuraishia capsulata CBS 1993]|uniref:ferric-chelate reductase (NADPH) n=1 Tax=Kuraishia capsulata CBS 1993 TaxID=1382522 RepID=W6MQA4_9ASCO|nr:uncharacterized protein KUCA_T00004476001 [Kuraishia capsulata CBS 1993]CDK28493.1 unnamed protein product [Kuraishia capsulata CBS 1993]